MRDVGIEEVRVGSELLQQALPGSTLVVAIDPGKVVHRVWFSTGEAGLLEEPRSVPSLRPGLDDVTDTIVRLAGCAAPLIAVEATGALHGSWVRALEERFSSSVRVFAPSQTAAARAQLGSRRFKSDDRDCAALTYLARQGQGRPVLDDPVEGMRAAVRYRRGLALVMARAGPVAVNGRRDTRRDGSTPRSFRRSAGTTDPERRRTCGCPATTTMKAWT